MNNAKKEIIFGAPGCGKTRYLLDILEKELNKCAPERVAFVSFTRKGAYEGLDRAIEKFDYTKEQFKYFKTLHAICFKELNMSKMDMLGRKDYRRFSKAMNMNFVGYYTEEFYHNDDRFLYLYFLKLNNYTMYKKIRDATEVDVHKLKHVALNYKGFKEHINKYDFTDLLLNVVNKNISLDIDVAIIDEAQDLTTLQWKTCEVLFQKAKRAYIAGDDDQAIYEWTGADINYFLNIEGKRTILDKSWRLQSNLLNFSKRITSMISTRVDKRFKPLQEGGSIAFYNNVDSIEFKDEESYYCLARNNYFLKRYEETLRKQLKLYMYKDKPSVDSNLVDAINNYSAYKKGTLSDQEAIKVAKYIKKDAGNIERLSWFEVFDMTVDEIFYYRQLIQNKIKIKEPNIIVNTIHGVKGGEADNVVLFMDVTRAVYKQLYNLSDSELRCLYVACTRAKKNLHIVHSKTKYSYTDIFKELVYEHNI